MKTKTTTTIATLTFAAFLTGCGDKEHGHDHADGQKHDHGTETAADHGHDHAKGEDHHDHDHEHDEVPLGTFTAGDMEIEAAQSHGNVEAGKEGHLVIKLPHNDAGATVVRAWIGTEDRTLSSVGRGDYAAGHDDYDIHTMAPDPLPEDAKWWVEIEKPDGTKAIGSIAPKK